MRPMDLYAAAAELETAGAALRRLSLLFRSVSDAEVRPSERDALAASAHTVASIAGKVQDRAIAAMDAEC